MPIEWTGLGPELLLRLDRKLGEPIGAQLERALREAICAVGVRVCSSSDPRFPISSAHDEGGERVPGRWHRLAARDR
jgi:hypothetical protein